MTRWTQPRMTTQRWSAWPRRALLVNDTVPAGIPCRLAYHAGVAAVLVMTPMSSLLEASNAGHMNPESTHSHRRLSTLVIATISTVTATRTISTRVATDCALPLPSVYACAWGDTSAVHVSFVFGGPTPQVWRRGGYAVTVFGVCARCRPFLSTRRRAEHTVAPVQWHTGSTALRVSGAFGGFVFGIR